MNFLFMKKSEDRNDDAKMENESQQLLSFDVKVKDFQYDRGALDGHCTAANHVYPYSDEKKNLFKGVLITSFLDQIAVCRHHDSRIMYFTREKPQKPSVVSLDPYKTAQRGNITAIQWLNERALLMGLCTGHLCIFDILMGEFSKGILLHLGGLVAEIKIHDGVVWTMFKDFTILCVPIEELIGHLQVTGSAAVTDNTTLSFRKLQLMDQKEVMTFLPSTPYPSLFETTSKNILQTVIAFGEGPAVAYYSVNPDMKAYSISELAYALAGKLGSAILSGAGRAAAWALGATYESETQHDEDVAEKFICQDLPIPARWTRSLEEEKRKVERISVGPNGRLAAAADNLGRVMLIDLKAGQVLRLWKGRRDAQLGWLEYIPPQKMEAPVNGSAVRQRLRRSRQLHLAILSPLRGMVEIWRMRHGPRVKVVGVHPSAVLHTMKLPPDDQMACYSIFPMPGNSSLRMRFEQLVIYDTDMKVTSQHAEELPGPDVSQAEKLRSFRNLVELRPGRGNNKEILKHFRRLDEPTSINYGISLLDSKMGLSLMELSFHEHIQNHALSVIEAKMAEGMKSGKKQNAIQDLHEKLMKRQQALHIYGSFGVLYQDYSKEINSNKGISSEPPNETWQEAGRWLELASENQDSSSDSGSPQISRRSSHANPNHPIPITFWQFIAAIESCSEFLGNTEPIASEFILAPQVSNLLNFFYKPLLCTVFSIQTLKQALGKLKWRFSKVMQCFASWLFTLSLDELASGTVYLANECILARWIAEMVVVSDEETKKSQKTRSAASPLPWQGSQDLECPGFSLVMQIQELCENTVKLEHALIIVQLYALSLGSVAERLADKAHTMKDNRIALWSSELLRKLRLCLLCNHRLGLTGTDRVTISLLENGDGGVYRLLAFDQLLNGYDLEIYSELKTVTERNPNAMTDSWQSFTDAATRKPSSESPSTVAIVSFLPHNNRPEIIACHCLKQLVTRGKLSKAVEWLKYIMSLEEHLGAAVALWMWECHLRTRCHQVSFSKGESQPCLNAESLALVIQTLHPLIKYSGDDQLGIDEKLVMTQVVGEETLDKPLWPPAHDHWVSDLQGELERQPLNRASVRLHLSLVQARLAQVQADLTNWELRDLYTRPDELCAPNALQRPCEESRQDFEMKKKRLRFLSNGLKQTPFVKCNIFYELAESFAIPRQEVRNLHVVVLLEIDQDGLAEHVLLKCDDVSRIAEILVQVFQQRLCRVLEELEKNRKFTVLLAELDADAVEWIKSSPHPQRSSPQSSRKGVSDLSQLSMNSTQHMLSIILKKIDPASASLSKAQTLLQVVEHLLQLFEGNSEINLK